MDKKQLLEAAGFDVSKVDFALPQTFVEDMRQLGITHPPDHFCYTYEDASVMGRLVPFSEAMWRVFDHVHKANMEIAEQLGREESTPRQRALVDFLIGASKISLLPVDYNLLIQAFEAGAAAPPALIPTDPLDESRSPSSRTSPDSRPEVRSDEPAVHPAH